MVKAAHKSTVSKRREVGIKGNQGLIVLTPPTRSWLKRERKEKGDHNQSYNYRQIKSVTRVILKRSLNLAVKLHQKLGYHAKKQNVIRIKPNHL